MAITFNQNPAMTSYASSAGPTATFGTTTSGSLLVAQLSLESPTVTATASDSINGAYNADGWYGAGSPANPTTKGGAYVFSVQNPTGGGSPVVTFTLSGATYGTMKLYELLGVAASSYVDSVLTADFGSGRSTSSLTLTTLTANCCVILGGAFDTTAMAADTGFTQAFAELGQFNAHCWGEYELNAGAAGAISISCGGLNLNAQDFGLTAVAYKAATGGGSPALMGQILL